jgi:archaellin
MNLRSAAACLAALAMGLSGTLQVAAQETPAATTETATTAEPAGDSLRFELNKAETVEGACQLTFVVQNNTGTVINASSYNMAIIDSQGKVSTLITFEFRPLTLGRPKVQAFGLAGIPCENISAISINEFVSCDTGDGTLATLCEEKIEESSRTSIEFPWEL